jgi:hypothetical protein
MAGIIFRTSFAECNIFRFNIGRPLQSIGMQMQSRVGIKKVVEGTVDFRDFGLVVLEQDGRGDNETCARVDVAFSTGVMDRQLAVRMHDSVLSAFEFKRWSPAQFIGAKTTADPTID